MFLDKFNINILSINVKDFIIIALIVSMVDFIAFKLFITNHFHKLVKSIQKDELNVNLFGTSLSYLFITLVIYLLQGRIIP